MFREQAAHNRLIIVSNRLPIMVSKAEDGQWRSEPASGGLVTALGAVLHDRGGLWIGWPGTTEEDACELPELLSSVTEGTNYSFKPVVLTAAERDRFYLGFANEVIWPLFHDLQTRCNFDPSYWVAYEEVNRKFARVVAQHAQSGDYVWVHDYHLMNVADELRKLGTRAPVGFFLHIPFPPLDIFLKLPWRSQILRALLEYDLIGFQTMRDRQNFIQCVRTLLKDVTIRGKGHVVKANIGSREVKIGSFPISIDFHEFAQSAASPEVEAQIREIRAALPNNQLIFGVDRLDYTKGIPERLEAFRNALTRFPELQQNVTLLQVVVPSRTVIREYNDLKTEVERLVGEINGQFTQAGWIPIHYVFRSLTRVELLAYYRTADIALITPVKDGMNLVCKEYCACSSGDSVLILSEFAGSAPQLQRGALLVNPYDIEGTTEAIYQAWKMSPSERHARMRILRRSTREQDIYWWVNSYLKASAAPDIDDFPLLEDYVPMIVME
jgi:trehalose 6-phosphate synthase